MMKTMDWLFSSVLRQWDCSEHSSALSETGECCQAGVSSSELQVSHQRMRRRNWWTCSLPLDMKPNLSRWYLSFYMFTTDIYIKQTNKKIIYCKRRNNSCKKRLLLTNDNAKVVWRQVKTVEPQWMFIFSYFYVNMNLSDPKKLF